ncbi:DNA glycosylase [Viridothelium virens]|uniref:DNA glycosylase n=1 Tax=Viridothelium virens TaxID=1048519 RepID=A0A6A6H2F7_VIRVR|nr:DNA glycosylase [Viridothelium virens]
MARRVTRSSVASSPATGRNPVKPEPQQLSSPPATPDPQKGKANGRKTPNSRVSEKGSKGRVAKAQPSTPAGSRKRTRTNLKQEEDQDELPHNLQSFGGDQGRSSEPTREDETPQTKSRKIEPQSPSTGQTKLGPEIQDQEAEARTPNSAKKGKKAKGNNYGLTRGETPFPDWPHPTPEECHEVVRELSKVHGEVKVPKKIPTPSLNVAGCGEVPSVLDALIRTRLSAATSNTNSSRAFQGLVQKFGIIEEGIGKGSVDWNKVRTAPTKEVFEAIKSGGLADVKSRDIKTILQLVYEENQARRESLVKAESDENTKGPEGVENENASEKKDEIDRAESNVLSLDHLHLVSNDEAFDHLIKYPGIGPKTASCVLLFCLQRPSFAVDTHVFRLCKWLRWVPPTKATRNTTYSHCEVRIPDDLKYPLHYLLIKHGKTCPRCRAITGEASADWGKGCPIERLVKRTGSRKGAAGGSTKKAKKSKKVDTDTDNDDESSGLSDLDEDMDELDAEPDDE